MAAKLQQGHGTGPRDIQNGWMLSEQPSYVHVTSKQYRTKSGIKIYVEGVRIAVLFTIAQQYLTNCCAHADFNSRLPF